jgi:DNA-binding transcriptional ArsR family regulator
MVGGDDSVNHLVEVTMARLVEENRLDDIFHALANRTRRALLRSLSDGPARVTELAAPHGMSLNAVSKHLFVLERAGLIRRRQDGHVQSCVLDARPMASAEEWIGQYRRFWNRQIDRLADFVEQRKR